MTSCRFSRWRISAILDFWGPIMGSLKSPCTTSYRSSIETIALNCSVFEKVAFFCILATDRQTNKQMDSIDALSRSRCRERRLNNAPQCIKICQGIKFKFFFWGGGPHREKPLLTPHPLGAYGPSVLVPSALGTLR